MPKFLNRDMSELAHQLTISPRRLRIQQLRGIETLLNIAESDRAYPYEFVCFHITGYHKRGPSTSDLVPAAALIPDLVSMAESISRKANLTVAELGETYLTQQELAEQLDVSTKTLRRWRSRGLMGVRVVFEDGVNRLAFLNRTVTRFVEQNKALVEKGASFKQLTDSERDSIVESARAILVRRKIKLHAAARIVAEQTGRAVETVRYTLRRYDEANPKTSLFVNNTDQLFTDEQSAIWRSYQAGESAKTLARVYEVKVSDIKQTLRTMQLCMWQQLPPECIYNDLFDAPHADQLFLHASEPVSEGKSSPRVPKDLPSYLQSLYRTPLLTPAQEQYLFRRYNYAKHKAATQLKALASDTVTDDQLNSVRDLLADVDATKQRIVKANLRLVVSIAKKHVGLSRDLFEIISDGNISLMRAVEKFDVSRGNKFSTYASWAIIKNFARSIPESYYHGTRYVTGQDLAIETAADHHELPNSPSDHSRVRDLIAAGLKQLPQRDQEIIAGHFGLAGVGGSLTLEQLGNRFGVTKERIRQIEQRALGRLRDVLSPSLADNIPS